jgi:hypothetical protein
MKENAMPAPDRIDYAGPGAGTLWGSDHTANRRYRAFQRQLRAAGVSQFGPAGFAIMVEDEGRVFYAIRRSCIDQVASDDQALAVEPRSGTLAEQAAADAAPV